MWREAAYYSQIFAFRCESWKLYLAKREQWRAIEMLRKENVPKTTWASERLCMSKNAAYKKIQSCANVTKTKNIG